MSKSEFKAGQRAIYVEDDGRVLVDVIANLCTEAVVSYQLAVVRTINPHWAGGALRAKHEFTMVVKRGHAWAGMPSLEPTDGDVT